MSGAELLRLQSDQVQLAGEIDQLHGAAQRGRITWAEASRQIDDRLVTMRLIERLLRVWDETA